MVPIIPFRSYPGVHSMNSCVRRCRFYWRLACPKAPALAQHSSYTECSADVFSVLGVQYHLFADDIQSDYHCPVTFTCIQSMLTRLSYCVSDLVALLSLLRLQAAAKPHRIIVYLVWLMCQPCKDPVRPAISTDLWDGHRQCWRLVRSLGLARQ